MGVENEDENCPMQELKRQIDAMHKKVGVLSRRSKHTEADFRTDLQSKTHENSLLIQEVTELRVEQKTLQRQARDLDLRVRQAENKLLAEREAREAAIESVANPMIVS